MHPMGKFPRPRGAGRLDCRWDTQTGEWIPQTPDAEERLRKTKREKEKREHDQRQHALIEQRMKRKEEELERRKLADKAAKEATEAAIEERIARDKAELQKIWNAKSESERCAIRYYNNCGGKLSYTLSYMDTDGIAHVYTHAPLYYLGHDGRTLCEYKPEYTS